MCIMEPCLENGCSEELIRSVILVVVFSSKTPSISLVVKVTEQAVKGRFDSLQLLICHKSKIHQ